MRKGISHCISASFRLSLLPDPSALPRGDISQAPLPGTPHTQTGTACLPHKAPPLLPWEFANPGGCLFPTLTAKVSLLNHGWSVPSRRGPFWRVRVRGTPVPPDPHLSHPRQQEAKPFPKHPGQTEAEGRRPTGFFRHRGRAHHHSTHPARGHRPWRPAGHPLLPASFCPWHKKANPETVATNLRAIEGMMADRKRGPWPGAPALPHLLLLPSSLKT